MTTFSTTDVEAMTAVAVAAVKQHYESRLATAREECETWKWRHENDTAAATARITALEAALDSIREVCNWDAGSMGERVSRIWHIARTARSAT